MLARVIQTVTRGVVVGFKQPNVYVCKQVFVAVPMEGSHPYLLQKLVNCNWVMHTSGTFVSIIAGAMAFAYTRYPVYVYAPGISRTIRWRHPHWNREIVGAFCLYTQFICSVEMERRSGLFPAQ